MILSISWKNIWRNRLRSLVVIIAITIGLFAGIFSAAMMNGMSSQKIRSTIDNEVGHLQIHNPKYLLNEELKNTIPDAESVLDEIQKNEGVVAVCKRLKIMGMANTSNSGTGVLVHGVNPEKEKQVFKLYTTINDSTKLAGKKNFSSAEEYYKFLKDSAGEYLSEDKRLPIVIGSKLAEKLKVRVRKKIVLTFQGVDGKLTGGNFRVVGIYRSGNTKFDEMNVFIRYNDLLELTGLPQGSAHEIVVRAENEEKSFELVKEIRSEFSTYKLNMAALKNLPNEEFSEEEKSKLISQFSESEMHYSEFKVILDNAFEGKLSDYQKNKIKVASEIGINVMSWKMLDPMLAMLSDFMQIYMYIFIVIILLALAFGIINTMLMVVLERVKELGMLMAVGMNKLRVFMMIMTETILLALTGGVIGMLISWFTVSYFNQVGIDISIYAEGLESIGYQAIMYPEIDIGYYLGVSILIILTGMLSSIYPAIKALKLNPAEAIRTEN